MPAEDITEEIVNSTYNTADSFGPRDTLHAILGLAGEVGELADTIKRHQFYGLPLDEENAIEELGDIFYYTMALIKCFDTSLLEAAIINRDKLRKRYPTGFTSEAAIIRADKE